MSASPGIRAALGGHEPTAEQWQAISADPNEPVCLIAGAGSGKTAVMAARIVWLIESHGYPPSQILGLTFTNKAVEELAARVGKAVSEGGVHRPEDITVMTYNAFAAGIVRDHGLLDGIEPDAGLLSEAQQYQLVLSCLDDLPAFEAIEVRSPGGVVRGALGLAGSIADHMVSVTDVAAAADEMVATKGLPPDVIETAVKRSELCLVVDAYVRAKRARQWIDFGDQVATAVSVMEKFPEVAASYRQRFPVVLLDEYQDTNVAQRKLIEAITGAGGSVTAVGDARQAIYAFRGATMYNLIGFRDHFHRSDGAAFEPISLSENFRSGRRILDVANAVVGAIPEERRPGRPLRPAPDNGEGEVHVGLFADDHGEAAWIAKQIEELHDTVRAEGRPPVAWRDIAILVRRKASMDPLLEALEANDIPVEVLGLGGLLKTPEVVEVVAWLRALETKPGANRWLARMLLGPRWRVHYRDLALCARWASTRNWELRMRISGGDDEAARDLEPGDVGFALAEALPHVDEIEGLGPEARRRLKEVEAILASLRARTGGALLDVVQEVIRASGIADALASSPSRAAPAARQNLSNFLDHVASFAPVDGDATLRSFIEYLDAAESAEETLESTQPAENDSVKLMTIHSAKGLEFECVFVPSMSSSRNNKGEYVYSVFPNMRSSNPLTSYTELPYEVREDREHLPHWGPGVKPGEFKEQVKERVREDERRLLYVSLTRAKQWLGVTSSWWIGRGDRVKGPSEFWDELAALADSGLVSIDVNDEQPEANPVIASLDRPQWPPDPRSGLDDELFPAGWGAAADDLISGRATFDELAAGLDEQSWWQMERRLQGHEADLDLIAVAVRPEEAPPIAVPAILSATSAVALAAGRMTAWDLVRPLPERPSAARRVGTEVHRLLEERSRGISPYPAEEELDEPVRTGEPGGIDRALRAWDELGYGQRTIARLPSGEAMVEVPFSLRRGEQIIRGRIDAVYEAAEGGVEIVDFKTGARFEPAPGDQLELYAEALQAMDLLPEDKPVYLTYVFLDGGAPVTREWTPATA